MKLLTIKQVALKVGYSPSQIWRKVKDGSFIRPARLGANRVVWPEHEVDSWILDRIIERDTHSSQTEFENRSAAMAARRAKRI